MSFSNNQDNIYIYVLIFMDRSASNRKIIIGVSEEVVGVVYIYIYIALDLR